MPSTFAKAQRRGLHNLTCDSDVLAGLRCFFAGSRVVTRFCIGMSITKEYERRLSDTRGSRGSNGVWQAWRKARCVLRQTDREESAHNSGFSRFTRGCQDMAGAEPSDGGQESLGERRGPVRAEDTVNHCRRRGQYDHRHGSLVGRDEVRRLSGTLSEVTWQIVPTARKRVSWSPPGRSWPMMEVRAGMRTPGIASPGRVPKNRELTSRPPAPFPPERPPKGNNAL